VSYNTHHVVTMHESVIDTLAWQTQIGDPNGMFISVWFGTWIVWGWLPVSVGWCVLRPDLKFPPPLVINDDAMPLMTTGDDGML
jgi:hypothetical protein